MRFLLILLTIVLVIIATKTLLFSTAIPLSYAPPKLLFQSEHNGVVTRLSEAIRFKTVSQQDLAPQKHKEFLEFQNWLQQNYPLVHQHLTLTRINGLSLLYRWQGRDNALKPALFLAHQDVVPIEPAAADSWQQRPFSGFNDGDFVWGRGTLDMKSTLTALLEAAEYALSQGFQPKRTLYFAFGHDEEMGGGQGAASIAMYLKQHHIELAYSLDEGGAILLPGAIKDIEQPMALVGIAEKGYATFELSVQTAGGHSSMPPRHTAIGKLSEAIVGLEANPMAANLDFVTMFASHSGDAFPLLQRLVLANSWLLKPVIENSLAASAKANASIRTTMAATMINAGVKDNVLAARASAMINSRILPGESIASTQAHIEALVKKDIKVSLVEGNEPSSSAAINHPYFQHIAEAIYNTFDEQERLATLPDLRVSPYLTIAGTDSKHFTQLVEQQYRFAMLILEANDMPRIHGLNERVRINYYLKSIQFYLNMFDETEEENSTSRH